MLHQSIRFASVGAVNTAVGGAVIVLAMFFLDAPPVAANLVGYVAGLALGFALNRRWTFASRARWSRDLPRYLAVVAVAYASNVATLLVATDVARVDPYVAQALAIGVYTALSFFGMRAFAFRRPASATHPSAR